MEVVKELWSSSLRRDWSWSLGWSCCLCLTQNLPRHRSRFGEFPLEMACLGPFLLLQLPKCPCLAPHQGFGFHALEGSVGITHYLYLFFVGTLLAQGKDLRCEIIHQRAWPVLNKHRNNNLSLIFPLPGTTRLKTPGFNAPFSFQFWGFYI